MQDSLCAFLPPSNLINKELKIIINPFIEGTLKYLLKNIAQSSLPRTIVLIVLGWLAWIPSLLNSNEVVTVAVTMGLTLINSLLYTRLFYKSGETNLPSSFVLATFWFAMSTVAWIHTTWQAQMVVFGVTSALLALQRIDFHHEATEEAFLATLICCLFAPSRLIMITGIILVWGYLIVKGNMTWRVWFASLIAIAIRVVWMVILHYLGWMQWLWIENIPQLIGLQWAIFGGVFAVTCLMLLLPLRKPSVASGAIYITFSLLLIGGAIWNGIQLLTI